ncbi:MFS transporter, partial [Streptomyces sp. DT225]
RWPVRLRRHLVPGGFAVLAAGEVLTGLVLRGGDGGSVALYAGFVLIGVGMALAFSPNLAGALADVRPQDAADASGVLVTVT